MEVTRGTGAQEAREASLKWFAAHIRWEQTLRRLRGDQLLTDLGVGTAPEGGALPDSPSVVVVVTGASRGIGRAAALRLSDRGFAVFATVRSESDALSLEEKSEGSIRTLRLDLADDTSIHEVADALSRAGVEALGALVNVAAPQGRAVPLEAVTRADLDEHFAVTGAGTMMLTASLIPLLKAGGGRIVNVGAGALAMPFLGAGFAAKHALETMSDVLRVELAETGIRVVVVEPGMTRWQDVGAQRAAYDAALDLGVAAVPESERARYRRSAEAFKRVNGRMLDRGADADDVATTIERALVSRHPKTRYHCGFAQRFAATLSRVAPMALTDRVVRRMVRL
jgi:NAD(P)-dependent dehydrogenase (short-subunit alcohol dehydrogenase family)